MVLATLSHACRHSHIIRGALRQQLGGWKQALSTTTYYDSQSGLHVPVHHENEITIFLNRSDDEPNQETTFVPGQLYKEDESSDMPDKIHDLREQGVHGVLLPPTRFPRDIRNLQTLCSIAPAGFIFFAPVTSPLPTVLASVSVVLDFSDDKASVLEGLKLQVGNGMKTTLMLGESIFTDGLEPISVANQVATLIDKTGGGDFLWVSPPRSVDEEDVVQLCEELMYLDVAGPTIKSRLVVDSLQEEVIDETMMIGVNKFVVREESEIDIVQEIATWQQKEIRVL